MCRADPRCHRAACWRWYPFFRFRVFSSLIPRCLHRNGIDEMQKFLVGKACAGPRIRGEPRRWKFHVILWGCKGNPNKRTSDRLGVRPKYLEASSSNFSRDRWFGRRHRSSCYAVARREKFTSWTGPVPRARQLLHPGSASWAEFSCRSRDARKRSVQSCPPRVMMRIR